MELQITECPSIIYIERKSKKIPRRQYILKMKIKPYIQKKTSNMWTQVNIVEVNYFHKENFFQNRTKLLDTQQ